MKPLISIGDLMSFGFQAIKETWKPTLKYTIWFFILPLAYYLLLAAVAVGGAFTHSVGVLFWIVYFGGMIAMVLGLIWAAISLFQYMLAYAGGANMKNWQPKKPALNYLPGLIWIGILTALPFFGTMIVVMAPLMLARRTAGGMLLTVLLFLVAIPFVIWLGTLFSQAQVLFLNDEASGVDAIRKSIDLVQKRWGAVFGRIFLPTIVFLLVLVAVQMVLLFIGVLLFVSLLGGWAAFAGAASHGQALDALRGANVGFGIVSILVLVAYGIFAFVISIGARIAQLIYQTAVSSKLFHSLEESK